MIDVLENEGQLKQFFQEFAYYRSVRVSREMKERFVEYIRMTFIEADYKGWEYVTTPRKKWLTMKLKKVTV